MKHKSIKLSALFLLASLSAFAKNIPEGYVVNRWTKGITINRFADAKLVNAIKVPATPEKMGFIEAILELTLNVEGNICTAEVETIQVESELKYNTETKVREQILSLSTSTQYDPYHPGPQVGCTAHSAPRNIVIPMKLHTTLHPDLMPSKIKFTVSTGYEKTESHSTSITVTENGYQID